MKTIRVSPTRYISGKTCIGSPGFGVLGYTLTGGGRDGNSILYDNISLPIDDYVECRILVNSIFGLTSVFVYEDGSFTANGSGSINYTLYKNGIAQGANSIYINITPSIVEQNDTVIGDVQILPGISFGVNINIVEQDDTVASNIFSIPTRYNSIRVDSTRYISNSICIGSTGLGVKGGVLSSDGFFTSHVNLPSQSNNEFRGFITNITPGLVFFAYEDGSYTYQGLGIITYSLYKDGQLLQSNLQFLVGYVDSTVNTQEDNDSIYFNLKIVTNPFAPSDWQNANIDQQSTAWHDYVI